MVLSLVIWTLTHAGDPGAPARPGASAYPVRPRDTAAAYMTPPAGDASDDLQTAIARVKTERNFGIVFLGPGEYHISKTLYIPRGIRVIGYGARRPVIVLDPHSPGFDKPDSADKWRARYMIWFTSALPVGVDNFAGPGSRVPDAGASTFYSALSNVDLRIGDGNPGAVALRTHFAQHSFISHVDIHIGGGKAGLFDGGNEIEDVGFYGGDYGICTTKPSPGWPFLLVDTRFEGQRVAAIKTQEAGLTIVRLCARHVPTVIDIDDNYHEKLFMESSRFDSITGPAIRISTARNAANEVNLRSVLCRSVPTLVAYRHETRVVAAPAAARGADGRAATYLVRRFTDGLCLDRGDAAYRTLADLAPAPFAAAPPTDITPLPPMDTWVNVKDLGAMGDGQTDDTRVLQDAIDKYPTIYLPQGWYRVSRTLRLRPNTALIGLTPIGTQIMLADRTPGFCGFGGPVPLVETPQNGHNIITGIGLSTGDDNSRAVACKWMSGDGSLMNDVKLVGGHGGMDRPQMPPQYAHQGPETWDTQYWSLWVTNGGGGTFKDIWSASTYATAGVYVSHTSTAGRIYALSVEHHVGNEVRFDHVAGWRAYALQLEEENRESTECQPMEIVDCKGLVFANLYMFRVIRVNKPYPWSVRLWGGGDIEFLNVHNYSQTPYTTTNPFYIVNTGTEVRPWEMARYYYQGAAPGASPAVGAAGGGAADATIAAGFEFAHALCADHKGNVFFCDSRMRRIYEYNAKGVHLLADYPWEPLSLACDKNDNLLVVFKYVPRAGEVFTNPPDAAGTSFSGWGNSGFATWVYAIDPANPDETIQLLPQGPLTETVLYPAHRWRDYHDFTTIAAVRPDTGWIAPDNKTTIARVYDLARATALTKATDGVIYLTDEYDKRTWKATADLGNMKPFAEKGELDHAVDPKGNVYIADGDIYVFGKNGAPLRTIHTAERPTSVLIDGTRLFYTGHNALHILNLPN